MIVIFVFLIFMSSYIGFISSVHDSLNFILPPRVRECFFEDFDKNSPTRTIEAFVQSGGNLDIILSVHGPLDLDEIRLVRRRAHVFNAYFYFLFFY